MLTTDNNAIVPPAQPPVSNGAAPTAPVVQPTSYDPNSVQDYAMKNKLVDKWTPENAAKLFEQQGLGTAAQYLGSKDKHSVYNAALLAKLKGYGGTTGKGISGGAAVGQGKNTKSAMDKAGGFVNPAAPTETPATGSPTPVDPSAGAVDPQTAAFDAQAETQINQLTTQHATALVPLQNEKTKAMAAAKQEYEKAGGIVSSTGEAEYIKNVGSYYDQKIDALNQTYNDNVNTVKTNTQNTKFQYQQKLSGDFKDYLTGLKAGDGTTPSGSEVMDAIGTAMASGKTFAQAKAEISGALQYAGRVQAKADSAEAHQQFMENHTLQVEQHAIDMEALALRRADRQDSATAVTTAKGLYSDFLKANTATQSLAIASRYMPDIEQAKDGKGPNALVLLDGYVKLANGGQAIRQTQFDTAVQSGTFGDWFKRLYNKGGITYDENTGGISGANVTISADQAKQIYNSAKSLVKEQIKVAGPDYEQLKSGVDEVKGNFPGNDETVDALIPVKNIGNLIDTYGGGQTNSQNGGQPNYSNTTFSGLNATIPGVGSMTFPSLEALNQFKKDNNL